MKRETWTLSINNKSYCVEFEHSIIFKAWYHLYVNSEKQLNILMRLDKIGADYEFTIDGHTITVISRSENLKIRYDLVVNGVSVSSSLPVEFIKKEAKKERNFKDFVIEIWFAILSLIISLPIMVLFLFISSTIFHKYKNINSIQYIFFIIVSTITFRYVYNKIVYLFKGYSNPKV